MHQCPAPTYFLDDSYQDLSGITPDMEQHFFTPQPVAVCDWFRDPDAQMFCWVF